MGSRKILKLRIVDIALPSHLFKENIACYVSMDSQFIDVISPITPDISETNVLKLIPSTQLEQIMFMVKHTGSAENSVGSILVPVKYFM